MRTKALPLHLSLHEDSKYDQSRAFCNVSTENGFEVMWEDENLVTFRVRDPACEHHFQVIPKEHIPSVRQLRKSNVETLKAMVNVGHQLLEQLAVENTMRKMGFHIPPFNSMGHLHLHVQALPYKNFSKKLKYPIVDGFKPFQKGFSWFVEAHQTISIIQQDRSVGLFPCEEARSRG
ncbi:scavenger mRNA decapping enzyme C-term binding-domain-containing protein [Lentinula lateritia]|uniref:Scavenger mRNA decapping enzyme C-term binding-domain-containing protein n=1 Tax=Lentinula lateritia TaxID=40482 RepID=A0ABQ8VDX7_9AGAR|nr:scavenger mRNA decapping enzyme C-term binding-domain-containing protein [Lentinula lateritia]